MQVETGKFAFAVHCCLLYRFPNFNNEALCLISAQQWRTEQTYPVLPFNIKQGHTGSQADSSAPDFCAFSFWTGDSKTCKALRFVPVTENLARPKDRETGRPTGSE